MKGLYDKIFTKEDMEKQTHFNKVRMSMNTSRYSRDFSYFHQRLVIVMSGWRTFCRAYPRVTSSSWSSPRRSYRRAKALTGYFQLQRRINTFNLWRRWAFMHCNSIFINPFCILKVTYYDKLLDTAEYSCVKNNGIREELHQVENRRFWSLCQLIYFRKFAISA